jgi:hypothetical protein
MWTALADGIRNSPTYGQYYQYLEAVRPLQETNEHNKDQWPSSAALQSYYKTLALHMRNTFPTKVVYISTNWTVPDMPSYMDYLTSINVGFGGPDTAPYYPDGIGTTFDKQERPRRNTAVIIRAVEDSELGYNAVGKDGGYTAQELFDFVNNEQWGRYMLWDYNTYVGTNEQRWFDQGTTNPGGILDVINSQPLTHTAKPATYP